MSMNVHSVLSNLRGKRVDIFYVLLLSSGKYTFLPELYDIFGRETTIKFLEVFAGCSVAVPTVENLEKIARSTSVYVRIEQATPQAQPSIIHDLADEYNVTEDRVRAIYAKTKVKLENELGLRMIKRVSK